MQIGLDKNGNRISIYDFIKRKDEAFCQTCGAPLVAKQSPRRLRIWHFAHKNDSQCPGGGEMSEWHLAWQSFFPVENREIIFEKNGEKRRADICVGDVVVEFQHSSMDQIEFDSRNAFYNSEGKIVIWLFDKTKKEVIVQEEYDDKNEYTVKRFVNPLKEFEPNKNVLVFFETDEEIVPLMLRRNDYNLDFATSLDFAFTEKREFVDFVLNAKSLLPKYFSEIERLNEEYSDSEGDKDDYEDDDFSDDMEAFDRRVDYLYRQMCREAEEEIKRKKFEEIASLIKYLAKQKENKQKDDTCHILDDWYGEPRSLNWFFGYHPDIKWGTFVNIYTKQRYFVKSNEIANGEVFLDDYNVIRCEIYNYNKEQWRILSLMTNEGRFVSCANFG